MPGTSPEAPRKTTSPPATPEAQGTYPVVGGPQRRPLPRASKPAEVKGAARGAQSLRTRRAPSTPTLCLTFFFFVKGLSLFSLS